MCQPFSREEADDYDSDGCEDAKASAPVIIGESGAAGRLVT